MVNVAARQPEKLFLGLRSVSFFQPALFLSFFLLLFFFFLWYHIVFNNSMHT